MIEMPPRPVARTIKAPQDTVAGCRLRARADLQASSAILTANQRIRLEKISAAAWDVRAAMLQEISEDAAVRKAKVQADRRSERYRE
jgi:hypothetical protein